ncbi:hypothetical protein V1514DRAFT_318949 [Lipomyces japonicus]|uniref:uncharacterized protein n=1 Tax=Lipomyces japonicus TaxID=56871 RepID=UPI0034CDCAF8
MTTIKQPTNSTLLFRLRAIEKDHQKPVLLPALFPCTISRTTGLPILTAGKCDPFALLLNMTSATGVAILFQGKAIRTREQINRLIALGRFGRKPYVFGLHDQRSAMTVIKKVPILDVLYLDDDSESDTSSACSTTRSSIFHRLARSSKLPQRKLHTDFLDHEGATAYDSALVFERLGLPIPSSLDSFLQPDHAMPDYAFPSATSPASYHENKRRSVVFSLGLDYEAPVFVDDERSTELSGLNYIHRAAGQKSWRVLSLPPPPHPPPPYYENNYCGPHPKMKSYHRKYSSMSSLDRRKLEKIYEEDEVEC